MPYIREMKDGSEKAYSTEDEFFWAFWKKM